MPVTIDELSNMAEFGGGGDRRGEVTFLPEPEPRPVFCPIISIGRPHRRAAAHVRRAASRRSYADRRPARRRDRGRRRALAVGGRAIPNVGFNAVAGRPSSEYGFEPTRFDEMRRGAWDIDARARRHGHQRRVGDRVLPVVPPRLRRPAHLAGARRRRSRHGRHAGMERLDLEEWCGRDPDRIIPMQIPWLRDPEVAADEIRRNAARGFKAVTFSESSRQARVAVDPHRLLGPVPRGVRGDRDGRVPPCRLVGRPRRRPRPTHRRR